MERSDALRELQDIDLTVARLDRQLSEMPEKRAILEARKRIDDISALADRTDSFVKRVEAEISRLEDDVAMQNAKLQTEQAKLLSGKIVNPREAQAISMELDALRRRKEKTEGDILDQMEKREKALEQRAKIDEALEAARAKEAELVEGFKGKGGTLQEEIERRGVRRAEIVEALDPETLERYERLRAEKSGVAVGVLADGTCRACRMELPADVADELLSGPDVAECPLCHRILVIPGDAEE
jgi:predicted  nucleic acid-binding Zn-ribbon protein